MLKDAVTEFERWLRIPPETSADLLIRYRAIWLLGFLFVAVQMLNLITMTFTYNGLHYDHAIAVVTSLAVLVIVGMLRWYKGYHFYAAVYSAFVLFGIAASALPERAGINSSLIPLLVIGPLLNGYISGRKATILFWGMSCLFLVFLYLVSISGPPRNADGLYQWEMNRLTNGIYYLSISAGLSTMLTEQTFSAMRKMRENAERARSAEAAKTEFLAKMSHELRTPLNAVIGLTDALLMGELTERDREIAKTIRESGDSLLLIVNDLLDLSKIEAGKMTITPRPIHLARAIETAVRGWRDTADRNGLSFHLDIAQSLQSGGTIDELRLRQIIHNLISNAIKFTDSGSVSVSAQRGQVAGSPVLVLRVTDTGCGISPSARDRVFDSFEQDSHGISPRGGGTGLGLPICRMLAELMGGHIQLEKSGPEGSVFCVTLPFVPVDIPVDPSEQKRDFQIAPDLRVLVVEDHQVNRLVLSEYLGILNVRYEMVSDGIECLDRLQNANFDIILMDKNMPRMKGVETTIAIRHSEQDYRDVRIVAVTADAMVGERERLLAAGMDGCLTKPFKIEELAMELAEASAQRWQSA